MLRINREEVIVNKFGVLLFVTLYRVGSADTEIIHYELCIIN
jgi:hypothetical protein